MPAEERLKLSVLEEEKEEGGEEEEEEEKSRLKTSTRKQYDWI